MQKYCQIARRNRLHFVPSIFSHTGQVHEAIMDVIYNQIKFKMQLFDPQVQGAKIQSVVRYWVRQLSSVINRTASRSIVAGAAKMVNRVNIPQSVILSSAQYESSFSANSAMA